MTKVVMGVRTKRMETGPNRWGNGRVHLLTYSRENKAWQVWCRPGGGGFLAYYGADVPDDTPVTCRKCLTSGLIR